MTARNPFASWGWIWWTLSWRHRRQGTAITISSSSELTSPFQFCVVRPSADPLLYKLLVEGINFLGSYLISFSTKAARVSTFILLYIYGPWAHIGFFLPYFHTRYYLAKCNSRAYVCIMYTSWTHWLATEKMIVKKIFVKVTRNLQLNSRNFPVSLRKIFFIPYQVNSTINVSVPWNTNRGSDIAENRGSHQSM